MRRILGMLIVTLGVRAVGAGAQAAQTVQVRASAAPTIHRSARLTVTIPGGARNDPDIDRKR